AFVLAKSREELTDFGLAHLLRFLMKRSISRRLAKISVVAVSIGLFLKSLYIAALISSSLIRIICLRLPSQVVRCAILVCLTCQVLATCWAYIASISSTVIFCIGALL